MRYEVIITASDSVEDEILLTLEALVADLTDLGATVMVADEFSEISF